MKKLFLTILAIMIFSAPAVFAEDENKVPNEIFTWIQSTPRGNYYFNHQQINYAVEDGIINLNVLIVPTLCTYDEIQIDDVKQKRRWRSLSLKGYNDLIGRADYLQFDLANATVQITERVDLDSTFTALDSDTSGQPIELASLSAQDVSCKFYRAIIKWAKDHHEMLIKKSRGKLSESDEKLSLDDMPLMKFEFPENSTEE